MRKLILLGILLAAPSWAARLATPDEETQSILDKVFFGLEYFKKECGRYPNTDEGLKAIHIHPNTVVCHSHSQVGEPRWEESIFVDQVDGWRKKMSYSSGSGKTYLLEASHGYFLTPESPQNHGGLRWTNPSAPPAPTPEPSPKPGQIM